MSYLVERDEFFYGEGLADLVELCEESERITAVINRMDCAARGHTVAWTSDSTVPGKGPPPGDYECLECGEAVTIE